MSDRRVTKTEWDTFIADYPGRLYERRVHWCQPPVLEVADPAISHRFRDAVVAWVRLNSHIGEGENEHFIVERVTVEAVQ